MSRRADSSPPAPHLGRLLARLALVDAPVVQLWAWPGGGAQELLEALAADPRALPLDASDLAAPARLRRALASLPAGGWAVAPALAAPPAVLDRLAGRLPAGRRLLFASAVRRGAAELATGWLGPEEFLLTASEVDRLWRQAGGASPEPAVVADLLAASDGWLRPLRLAAAAGGAPPRSASELLAVPGVGEFLRREVWETLPRDERPEWVRLAAEGGVLGPEAETPRSVAELGLALGPAGRRRLPALLAAFAAGESGAGRVPPPRHGASAAGAGGKAVAPARREIEVHLFGAGGARRAGEPDEIAWHLRRSFKVLAFLATSPAFAAERDELQEAVFWDVASADQVRRNFHPTLSHLRRALEGPRAERLDGPPAVVLRQGTYRLHPDLTWRVDAVEFEAGMAAGRAHARAGRDEEAVAAWEATWRLYRGRFLAGEPDPWITARRERFQRLHLELLRTLGEALGRVGRLADAADTLIASLLEDPLQERVALELMRVYVRLGRRDLARRQFERLSRDLRSELGVEPQREIADELSRLMGQ